MIKKTTAKEYRKMINALGTRTADISQMLQDKGYCQRGQYRYTDYLTDVINDEHPAKPISAERTFAAIELDRKLRAVETSNDLIELVKEAQALDMNIGLYSTDESYFIYDLELYDGDYTSDDNKKFLIASKSNENKNCLVSAQDAKHRYTFK